MSGFKSEHDLLQDTPAPGAVDDSGRSPYTYLFPGLANAEKVGLFRNTDEEGTLQRLKDFETACHLPAKSEAVPGLTIRLPAAYTYFGQFLNHDISAPIGGLLQNVGDTPPVGIIGTFQEAGLGKTWRAQDVETILRHFVNEHSDPLTLASLYADGPDSDDTKVRALYRPDRMRFELGKTGRDPSFDLPNVFHATDAPDILRDGLKPLIADQRNDGNLILSQLHLAFMLFHNKAVDALDKPGAKADEVFNAARDLVTLHYHWLVLNDFLPSLLSKTVLTKPLSKWDWKSGLKPGRKVPMEFTTAAFRFGHSMVGKVYDYNANFGQDGGVSPKGATLAQLFAFTSHRNMDQDREDSPRPLPDHWVIDWNRLTRELPPGAGPGGVPGQSERLDLEVAPDMLNEAGNAQVAKHGSIIFRNLLRGFHRRIPFGQELALACDVPVLSSDQVAAAMPNHRSPSGDYSDPGTAARQLGILDNTPAWLYFLCEARAIEHGERVGPTASKIIADTIVSLMRNIPKSVLNYGGGNWHPSESPLKNRADEPVDSIRAFLLCATEDIPAPPT